jgi:hypothetical protein
MSLRIFSSVPKQNIRAWSSKQNHQSTKFLIAKAKN